MKNKYFYGLPRWLMFLLLLMAARHLPAQKHGYNWLFGGSENNGICNMLDFRQNPPAISLFQTHPVLTSIKFNEYAPVSAAVSDSSGNFLFYVNYVGVWNNKGRIPGSDILEIGDNSMESDNMALILPLPGAANRYAVVHKNFPSVFNSVYWSVVEPLANNGVGRIVTANNLLLKGAIGEIQVCKHGNGRDWWIILPDISDQFGFWTFLLHPSGITGPFRHEIAGTCQHSNFISYKSLSISPDGRWLVRRQCTDSIGIYAFDRCSGTASLHKSIPHRALTGFEPIHYIFSPDQRFLYVISGLEIYSIDLSAPDLPSLPKEQLLVSVGNPDSDEENDGQIFGSPLMGPDRKIYITQNQNASVYRDFFYVMHRPNLPGLASDIAYRGIEVSQSRFSNELFVPNYQLGKWTASPCDSLAFRPSDDQFRQDKWDASAVKTSKEPVPPMPLLYYWKGDTLIPNIHPLSLKKDE